MMADKLSGAMIDVLAWLAQRPQPLRDSRYGAPIPGLSWTTFEALQRRGYCEWDLTEIRLTEAGIAALAAQKATFSRGRSR
jgi:hypothetical protein